MRTAVVLFNLGGPDSLGAVEPFLRNLFSDPAILRVPGFIRGPLAWWIARRRAPIAREIYGKIGGKSPLLELTRDQAAALERKIEGMGEVQVFVTMRYWHPRADETAAQVKKFAPDRVVLLPLYPQYSTTTTASSLKDWNEAAERSGLRVPTASICCYPTDPDYVAAQAARVAIAVKEATRHGKPRVLFSAHGLPKQVVAAGDPYQWQVEKTAAAVAAALKVAHRIDGLDWTVCYQSRVGPLEWIGPSTEDEIRRAGRDRVPVVVVPVAFVSEHSETLVELDIEYRHLAETAGIPAYLRVPALGTDTGLIRALAGLVRAATPGETRSERGERLCPSGCQGCALAVATGEI